MKPKRTVGQIVTAVLAFMLAVMAYSQSRDVSGAFRACAFILLGWRVMFIGLPWLNVRIGEVYRASRERTLGWAQAAKLCDMAVLALLVASAVVA